MNDPAGNIDTPFNTYLNSFKQSLAHLFRERCDLDQMNTKRGLPPFVINQIQNLKPLAYSIPVDYGGKGMEPQQILAILEACSYESLPLSLVMGINGALFLEPLAKYGPDQLKSMVFSRFLNNNSMGGLMITEPDFGTSALGMETCFEESPNGFHITGEKHWAGLSGWADFWLMTARQKRADGSLTRDISFFVCDSSVPGQVVKAREYYQNVGLLMIPYALNLVDVEVPEINRLVPKTTGIRMLQELLHRSRMRFPGMAIGFVKRMFDEAIAHCRQRVVGGKPLTSYDQVQRRLVQHQCWATICSAFCRHGAGASSVDQNMENDGLFSNTHKALLSDIMHEASQSLMQLVGAKGYRLDHIAGRSFIDTRPFQIFEGSNDVIYDQIWEATLKLMSGTKEKNLARFVETCPLFSRVGSTCSKILDFRVDSSLSQRRRVDLGRIIGRIVAIDLVLLLGDTGFNGDMITNAIDMLREEIAEYMAVFQNGNQGFFVDEPMADWF